MQLYDPATGTWYEYTPPSGTGGSTTGSGTGIWTGSNPPPIAGGGYTVPGGPGGIPWPNSDTGSGGGTTSSPLTPINHAPLPGGSNLLAPTGSAADMAAAILREQYADWQNTYRPIELNLLGQSSLNNPEVLTNAVNQASTQANQSFDTMEGVKQRQMAARGIGQNAQQKMVSDRLTNLSRAGAVAGGENTARRNVATRDELIALGTAPNPQIVQGSRNSQYSQGG